MIAAAGILFMAKDGRVLLVRRSAEGDHAGEWGIPGGKVEPAEEPFCRCFGSYIYSVRKLPEDMVTEKGREAMEAARARVRAA